MFIFGSHFERLHSIVIWPCCFGPVEAQHIMVRAHGFALPHGYWEAKTIEEDGVPITPSRTCPQ
jgi:hypothetical protein